MRRDGLVCVTFQPLSMDDHFATVRSQVGMKPNLRVTNVKLSRTTEEITRWFRRHFASVLCRFTNPVVVLSLASRGPLHPTYDTVAEALSRGSNVLALTYTVAECA